MPIEPLHNFKVVNLANNYLSEASKDTYLICQRLDRIIKLLEAAQSPPTFGPVSITSGFPVAPILEDNHL